MVSNFSPGKTETTQMLVNTWATAEWLPEAALLSMETHANPVHIDLIRDGNGLTLFWEAGKKLTFIPGLCTAFTRVTVTDQKSSSPLENLWLDAAAHTIHWGAPAAAIPNQRLKHPWQRGSPMSQAPKVHSPISLCALHTAARRWRLRLCPKEAAKSSVLPSLRSSDLTL